MEILLLIIVLGLGGLITSLLLFFGKQRTYVSGTYQDSQAFFKRAKANARRMR